MCQLAPPRQSGFFGLICLEPSPEIPVGVLSYPSRGCATCPHSPQTPVWTRAGPPSLHRPTPQLLLRAEAQQSPPWLLFPDLELGLHPPAFLLPALPCWPRPAPHRPHPRVSEFIPLMSSRQDLILSLSSPLLHLESHPYGFPCLRALPARPPSHWVSEDLVLSFPCFRTFPASPLPAG